MRASIKTSLFILLTWTLFLLKGYHCQTAPVAVSVVPDGGKIKSGSSVIVQCSLVNANSNVSLIWYRCQEDIRYKIGTDNVLTLNNGDVGNHRYLLEQVVTKDNTKAYKLTLTDAKLEDSATFECRLSTGASARASVSVCSDTSSKFCDCIADKGWASPNCFTSQLNTDYAAAVDSSRKEVVGLIIALCVVVAYSIVLILVKKRKCLRQCCTEEQSEEERKLNGKAESEDSDRGQTDPSDSASDSATCSTSDPSSSGGSDAHGSSQSMPSSQTSTRRLVQQQTEQEQWNRNQKPHKKGETSFTITPEVHYSEGYNNQGYTTDNQPQAEDKTGRNIGHQTNYQADVAPNSLSGHGAIGGQPETPFRYNISSQSSPQPTRNQPRINTEASETTGAYADPRLRNTSNMYSSQVLNPHASSLDVAGTEI